MASAKGALEKTRSYLTRLDIGTLPAPWDQITGVVLTQSRGTGKLIMGLDGSGGQSVRKGPKKQISTTEWLYYVDKDGTEYGIDPRTKKIVGYAA